MSWQTVATLAAVLIVTAFLADVRRSWRASKAMEAERLRLARMDIIRPCQDCGEPVSGHRRAWGAPTCGDCAGIGCSITQAEAEAGGRCDNCDCLPPVDVWPVHG